MSFTNTATAHHTAGLDNCCATNCTCMYMHMHMYTYTQVTWHCSLRLLPHYNELTSSGSTPQCSSQSRPPPRHSHWNWNWTSPSQYCHHPIPQTQAGMEWRWQDKTNQSYSRYNYTCTARQQLAQIYCTHTLTCMHTSVLLILHMLEGYQANGFDVGTSSTPICNTCSFPIYMYL